ncbi:MAG: ABC transporter ATP-binding protein [Proteobacteria bacterium]|nr:ABC transporter ATP-binding protein [Pseudomonadota bacterium]
MLKLRNVCVKRGDFTLEVNELDLKPGYVLGVVGPNGAGKTTLLELLPGLTAPESGSVRFEGLDPRQNPVAVRSHLGYMTDDMPVFNLRIDRLLRTLSGYYPNWNDELVGRLLERFALDEKKSATSLSKGQATRLRLLLALAFEPALLVLDEPATGLDVSGRRALLESVLEVMRDDARSVIISSHQLADVERIADQLLVLHKGRVVRQGPTDALVGDERTLEEALVTWRAI